jgi:hypothetical protein
MKGYKCNLLLFVMDTKQELINHVKKWIQIDNEIIKLQKKIKEYREEKKGLTTSLVDTMKTNQIDCFDINDGKLIYAKSKHKKPINKKLLLEALQTYFKDNNDMAQNISEHILNSREETITESIKRKKEK